MDLTPTNAILLANLRANYGTFKKYKSALANLPWEVCDNLAIPPEVLTAFRNISPTDTHIEAQKGSNETQDIKQSNAPKMGCCTVHSVLAEPQWLLSKYKAVHVGRENKSQQLSASPLANLSPMLRKSQGEKQKLINHEIERLITCLEVRKGKAYGELRRLALRVRDGEELRLTYAYEQGPNHADAIALVVQGLAEKQGVKSIVGKLRALLPAEQIEVF